MKKYTEKKFYLYIDNNNKFLLFGNTHIPKYIK